jgi:cephalosporin-C deacetylase-like acetyl esterase
MELKEVFYDNIYYYTNVFEDAKKIIDTFEELDSVPESYPIIEK